MCYSNIFFPPTMEGWKKSLFKCGKCQKVQQEEGKVMSTQKRREFVFTKQLRMKSVVRCLVKKQ